MLCLLGAWELAARWELVADALSIEPFLIPAPSDVAEALWQDRDAARRERLGDLAGGARRLRALARRRRRLRARPAPLGDARGAPSTRCWSPRRPSRSSSSRRSWSSGSGSGSRPKLADHRADLLLPDHRQHARRAALGGRRRGEADADARRRPGDDPAPARAADALPFLFSGAKIAVAVAVIGAVFGEWAGSDSGLGHLMLESSAQLLTARLFAAVGGALGASRSRSSDCSPGRAPRRPGGARRDEGGRAQLARGPRVVGRRRSPAAGRSRRRATARPSASTSRSTSTSTPTTPGSTRRSSAAASRRRASTCARRSPPTRRRRSSRSPRDGLTWRSPMSPRSCSPATRASTWSPSEPWCRSRSPR